MLFCRDCRFVDGQMVAGPYDTSDKVTFCGHTQAEKPGLTYEVDGHVIRRAAWLARGADDICGPDGKLFERRRWWQW